MGPEADVVPATEQDLREPTAWGLSIEGMRVSLIEQSKFVTGGKPADAVARFHTQD